MQLGAVVLCGGESQRMGRDKASLPFGEGQTLLGSTVQLVAEVVGDGPIVCVAAADQQLPKLPASVAVVEDRQPDCGPLEALATGLQAVEGRADAALATACDMPLLKPKLGRHLFDLLGNNNAVVPVIAGHHQPLLSVYRCNQRLVADRLLQAGKRSLQSLVQEIRFTVELKESDLREFDEELVSFLNCNDEAAYERALEIFEHGA